MLSADTQFERGWMIEIYTQGTGVVVSVPIVTTTKHSGELMKRCGLSW